MIEDVMVMDMKKHKSSIITMVGGGYITSAPKVAMTAISEIDIGMIGEGEITICELIDALSENKSLMDIQGIIYRDSNGDLLGNIRRAPNENLDSLPYPDVPDILIVAVGDANLNIALDKINVISKSAGFDLSERVVLLGELFDEGYKFAL